MRQGIVGALLVMVGLCEPVISPNDVQAAEEFYLTWVDHGTCSEVASDSNSVTESTIHFDASDIGDTEQSATTLTASMDGVGAQQISNGMSFVVRWEQNGASKEACSEFMSISDTQWEATIDGSNEASVEGVATITNNGPGSKSLSVILWNESPEVTPTQSPAVRDFELVTLSPEEQVSGEGGVGNTRDDILGYWNISASISPYAATIEEGYQSITYNLPDYQITFLFQLQGDDQVRGSDRLIEMIVGFMGFESRTTADRMVEGWLPQDAEAVGSPTIDGAGNLVQQYHSMTMAQAIPQISFLGFDSPGRIWVQTWPAESTVGVIQISLYNPAAE